MTEKIRRTWRHLTVRAKIWLAGMALLGGMAFTAALALEDAYIPWGSYQHIGTNDDIVSSNYPLWFGSAFKTGAGEWDTNLPAWVVSPDNTNDAALGMLFNRAMLTNNLVMQLGYRDSSNASLALDLLLMTNQTVMATNLIGNFLTGSGADTSLTFNVSLMNPNTVGLQIRRGEGAIIVRDTLLAPDCDGDGYCDTLEIAMGSNPYSALSVPLFDSDGDGMSDGDELALGLDPFTYNSFAHLPFLERFETNTVQCGDINGQNLWQATPANAALVQTNAFCEGKQALAMSSANTQVEVRQFFGTTNAPVVWLDTHIQAFDCGEYTNTPADSALMTFDASGFLKVYDGLKASGDKWVALTNMPPCALTGEWTRVTVKLDYATQRWLVCLNGILARDGLGFAVPAARLAAVTLTGYQGGMDALSISTNKPAGLSLDGDLLSDDWEIQYFGNLNQTDSSDSDQDGLTDLEEYQNGTSPLLEDTDGDGLPDEFEIDHGLNPLLADYVFSTIVHGQYDVIMTINFPQPCNITMTCPASVRFLENGSQTFTINNVPAGPREIRVTLYGYQKSPGINVDVGTILYQVGSTYFTNTFTNTVVALNDVRVTGYHLIDPATGKYAASYTAETDPAGCGVLIKDALFWRGGGTPSWANYAYRFSTDLAPGVYSVSVINGWAWENRGVYTENVMSLDITKEKEDHVCVKGPHDAEHKFKVTVLPDPAPVAAIIKLDPAANVTFLDGSVETNITSTQDLSVTGLVAVSGATITGHYDFDGSPYVSNSFDVVNVDKFVLSNANCGCVISNATDTTQDKDTPSAADATVEVMMKTNVNTAKLGLTLTWNPESHGYTNFWKLGSASGIFPASGQETQAEVAVEAGVTNDVKAWFDCDNSGSSDPNDEPERDLKVLAVRLQGLKVKDKNGFETFKLGLGDEGKASVTTLEPADRKLSWSYTISNSCSSSDSQVKITTNQEGNVLKITVAEDSGPGTVTLSVQDSRHSCVKEELKIKVGCESCSSGTCSLGASATSLCSVHLEIGLGRLAGGGSAGAFRLDLDKLDQDSYKRDKLEAPHRRYVDGVMVSCDFGDDTHIVSDHDGVRQYKSPEGVVDVTNSPDGNGYVVKIYPNSQNDGFNPDANHYVWKNDDGHTASYRISNPDYPSHVYNRLQVTETRAGHSVSTIYGRTGTDTDHTWTMTTGNGLRTESLREYETGPILNKVRETRGADNRLLSRKTEELSTFPWGRSVTRQVVSSDQGDLTTTWSYYADAPEARIETVTNPDGSWEHYDYDAQGRQTAVTRGFKDGQPGSTNVAATLYDYTPFTGEIPGYQLGTARRVIETIQGLTNSISFHAYMPGAAYERLEISERAASPTNSFGAAGNQRAETVYYHENHPDSNLVGRVKSSKQSDGRLSTYEYMRGSFDPLSHLFVEGAGDYQATTVIQGTTNNPAGIAGKTTASLSITDKFGRQVFSQECFYDGTTYVPVNWTATFSDEAGHATNTVFSNGTSAQADWGCCSKDRDIDANGGVTEYLYDDLKRLTMSVRLGAGSQPDLATFYTYDAEGRQLTQLTTASGLSQGSTNTYDLAGRLATSVDQSGVVTSYANGGLTNTTIQGGLTNVTVNYQDGRTKYTQQNGVIKSWNDYGVNSDGTQWSISYSGPLGTNSPVWQKSITDMLGRTIRTERPGFGGTTLVNESFYNDLGQLVSTTGSYQPTTLSEYNELGKQFRSGVDVNTNGVLDLAGPERVSESASWFEQDANQNVWQVSVSILYAGETSATPTTNSIQKTRLTGLGTSSEYGTLNTENCSFDLLGNQSTSRTYVNRATKTVTQVAIYPDSVSNAVQVAVNGQLAYSISKTGTRTDYTFDSLGRQISALQGGPGAPRTVGAYTAYNLLGQVASTMDTASNVTTFVYDNLGRRTAVTDALTNTTYTAYNAEGQVLATWGATYPVAYDYDDSGRMTSMYTYRGTNTLSSYSEISNLKSQMDRTTWLYDLATGLLTNKLYSDNKGPSYTYSSDGKLLTRTWARGVVTTYSYDALGQLTNISYSDGTPAVTFAFDRLGRQTTITDGAGTRSFTYNDALQLESEICNQQSAMTHQYDALGRPAGLDAGPGYSVRYGFDLLGRFSAVSNNVGGALRAATYSYLPGSEIIQGYTTDDGFSLMRAFEPTRNLISSITNRFGGTQLHRFDYTNDEIGRRTKRSDFDLSTSVSNFFAYNIRSELEDAAMGQNTYSYRYDPIGNRRIATNNSAITEYLANSLNQYSTITGPSSTSTPSYDLDGNMTTNGQWTFTWDAENRLTLASNTVSSLTVKKTYDYMSRRVKKTSAKDPVWNEDHTDILEGGFSKDYTYTYDGWNLVRERELSRFGGMHITIIQSDRSYVWGLDLSGTAQGAGGIGGLISSTQITDNQQPITAFYCYDANGNVTDLVGTNGDFLAQYQYDPYGNTIAKSGTLADVNPFRFSTKYLDPETGLYYYGHRYFMPEIGRWASRDPLGERGGLHLYGFVDNDPVTRFDMFGLWKSGQHTTLTQQSYNDAFPNIPSSLQACSAKVLQWLTYWNLQQDQGNAFNENQRHFNRAIDNPVGSGVAAGRQAYTTYLGTEMQNFNNALQANNPSQQDCQNALQAAGRLSHSWQDYYAHGVVLQNGGHTHILWTANPAITGSPDNTAGTGGIAPSSWGGFFNWGEHGGGEVDGNEGTTRQTAARQYVRGRYQTLLYQWSKKCLCVCKNIGNPP